MRARQAGYRGEIPTPMEVVAGFRQFSPDPSVGAHKMALRHNSKSLRDELNSFGSGLIICATFTPSEQTCERSVSNEDPQADVTWREQAAKARLGRTRQTRADLEQQLRACRHEI